MTDSSRPFDDGMALLALLISTDLAFILLFGLRGFGVLSDDGFLLTYDRSYAEVFRYVKFFWLVLLLLWMSWERRTATCLGLAGLFAFLLLDDYAKFHENWGVQVAEGLGFGSVLRFGPKWMFEPSDFGELFVFVAGYAVIGGCVLLAVYKSAPRTLKRFVLEMVGLLALLGVFAAGIDFLHSFARLEIISGPIGALEDGGELLIVSLLVWRAWKWSPVHACDTSTAGKGPLAAEGGEAVECEGGQPAA